MPADPKLVLDGKVIANLRAIRRPGSPDLVHELVTIFRSDAEKNLLTLARHLAAADLAEAANLAHRMKGSAGMIGLMRLAARCAAIEQACRARNRNEAESLLPGLESDLATAWQALDAVCHKP